MHDTAYMQQNQQCASMHTTQSLGNEIVMWWCFSGGRIISVTGYGFNLVQSVRMEVSGVGQMVRNNALFIG